MVLSWAHHLSNKIAILLHISTTHPIHTVNECCGFEFDHWTFRPFCCSVPLTFSNILYSQSTVQWVQCVWFIPTWQVWFSYCFSVPGWIKRDLRSCLWYCGEKIVELWVTKFDKNVNSDNLACISSICQMESVITWLVMQNTRATFSGNQFTRNLCSHFAPVFSIFAPFSHSNFLFFYVPPQTLLV